MRGRVWLSYFTTVVRSEYRKFPWEKESGTEWTEFMGRVMDSIAKKMNCHVARRRKDEREFSGEYMNIDAFFIDDAEDALIKDSRWDAFVLPRAVVELHNYYDPMGICYCLWKILCVRAPIRVLICYQQGVDKVLTLKQKLEDVLWHGSLMKGTDGDLLVLIGDEKILNKKRWSWGEYLTVFEWRNDKLEKIEGLKW